MIQWKQQGKYVIVISQAGVGYHCYYDTQGQVLKTMISYECL